MFELTNLVLYRIARSHNQVPDDAPRSIHWRSLDAAMMGVAAWWNAAIAAGDGGLWRPCLDFRREVKVEFRLMNWTITPTTERANDEYAGYVVARSNWAWRRYTEERHKLETVVEGVVLSGWSATTRVYDSDWSELPARNDMGSPVDMNTRQAIPIVRHCIEIVEQAHE